MTVKKKALMFSAGAGIAVVCVGVLSAATFLPDPITFSNEPELTVIPVITDPSDIALPVDQFLPSAEEIRTMQHGTYEAVATCMKEFGLDFEVQPEWYSKVSMFPVEGSEFSYAGLYGLLDSEQAERKGYHAGPNTLADPSGCISERIGGGIWRRKLCQQDDSPGRVLAGGEAPDSGIEDRSPCVL